MRMTWLDNITWQKLVLLLVIILILTRILAPDTAEWMRRTIVDMTMFIVDAIPDFGG